MLHAYFVSLLRNSLTRIQQAKAYIKMVVDLSTTTKKNQKTYTLYLTNSPAVSFCVTSLPSSDEASADVSPIVSVADTRK